MSKFKVGDKVRILDGSKIDDYRGDWTSDMNNYIGKVCTIRKASGDKPTGYWMKEIDYIWDERGLDLVTEKHKFNIGDVVVAKKNNGYFFTTDGWKGVVTKAADDWFDAEEFGYPKQKYEHLRYDGFKLSNGQKIVITHDGKTTTAKLYDDKKVVKTATARCNPSDEFDFNVGASIALERLTGQILGNVENTIEEGLDFDEFLDAITCIEKFLRQLND